MVKWLENDCSWARNPSPKKAWNTCIHSNSSHGICTLQALHYYTDTRLHYIHAHWYRYRMLYNLTICWTYVLYITHMFDICVINAYKCLHDQHSWCWGPPPHQAFRTRAPRNVFLLGSPMRRACHAVRWTQGLFRMYAYWQWPSNMDTFCPRGMVQQPVYHPGWLDDKLFESKSRGSIRWISWERSSFFFPRGRQRGIEWLSWTMW